ncbi:MAG: NF038132 family protein [Thiobacillus sp.]
MKSLGALSVLAASTFSFSGPAAAAPLPAGWTCTANCGTLGADGVVTVSPEGGTYGYVSSNGGVADSGIGLGSETNGSRARTSLFSATAGDDLEFYFNYVTSDGAQYTEYAWVRLLGSALSEVALLFTARTNPTVGGDTVPGFSMPALADGVVLDPPSTPIIPGGPVWSPLDGYSGDCWSTGCGYTD